MVKKEDIKLIIFPDIHGRTFWKDGVKGNEDKDIVFLGDYIDPYPQEGIYPDEAMSNFREIIKFKKEHKDNVTLLLGNHDLHYIWEPLNGGRKSRILIPEMEKILKEEKELFRMCYETEVNGQKYLLSHAGILRRWLENLNRFPKVGFVEYINDLWLNNTSELLPMLSCISWCRGGFNAFGSMIWADMTEHLQDNETIDGYFQIFGHTQLQSDDEKQLEEGFEIMKKNNFICIDIHKPFILTNDGKILQYGKNN